MLPNDPARKPLTRLNNFQSLYKRSFALLESSLGETAFFEFMTAMLGDEASYVSKVLYPFFNQNNVRVGICGYGSQWGWTFGYCTPDVPRPFPTRTAAESAAFMAAFGKLEGILAAKE